MAFKAADKLDPLDYDFAPFVEAKGTTPEFSVEQIKAYWNGLQNMQRRHLDALNRWQARRNELGDNADAGALDDFEREYQQWQSESADERVSTRIKLLAMLCSNQPDAEVLSRLPGRVLDSFETAMQDELTPKALRPATT